MFPLLPSNSVCLPALHCWIRSGSILLTHPDLPTVLQFDCCSGHTLKSHSLFILHPSIVETAGIVRMSQRGFPSSAACLTKTRLLFGLLRLSLPHSSGLSFAERSLSTWHSFLPICWSFKLIQSKYVAQVDGAMASRLTKYLVKSRSKSILKLHNALEAGLTATILKLWSWRNNFQNWEVRT